MGGIAWPPPQVTVIVYRDVDGIYCFRPCSVLHIVEEDKGMPKGWLYHLRRHDRNGKAESRDTFGRKLACCLSVCLRYL